jgi:hypothetical protein
LSHIILKYLNYSDFQKLGRFHPSAPLKDRVWKGFCVIWAKLSA